MPAAELASFVELLAQTEGDEVEFSAFDARLSAAASAERAARRS